MFRELGMDPGNGVCKFLDQDTNLCTIYEDRPLICRVDDLYNEVQLSKSISKRDWHRVNEKICKKLQEEEVKRTSPINNN